MDLIIRILEWKELISTKEIFVLYDKLLVIPEERTSGRIIVPDGTAKSEIRGGRVIKTGKGYPLVNPDSDVNVWEKGEKESGIVRKGFLPLSVKIGDYVWFFQKQSVDIVYESKMYLVVPESSVVLVETDEIENMLKNL